MRNLFGMEVLVKVVEKGSFSAAAQSLNITSSAVSKQISRVEAELGVSLLSRSTHKLSLTEAGKIFHDRSVKILRDMDSVRDAVQEANASLTGTLKIHITPGMTGRRFVIPALREFQKRHPQLTVDLTMSREPIDIVEAGYDMSIQNSTRQEVAVRSTSLAHTEIGKSRYFICASPEYLLRHSRPAAPRDLANHNCLLNVGQPSYDKWWFTDGRRRYAVKVDGLFRVNDGIALQEAAIAGLGIARLLAFERISDITILGLKILFEKETICDRSVWASYPRARNLPVKVTSFIDFLIELLGR